MNEPSESNRLDQRVTQMETLLMHVEHTVAQLDQVIQGQALEQNRLLKKLELLQHRLDQLEQGRVEGPLDDEKPPHY
jgi:uncharacterized coiled-coil protein SlyX